MKEQIDKIYIKRYITNPGLMFAAAESIGYSVEKLVVDNKTNINQFGFIIRHNDKLCYISKNCFFPDVLKWQMHLTSNKILTDSLLNILGYDQIHTLFIDHKKEMSKEEILEKISDLQTPIIVKPTFGQDGQGIHLVNSKEAAYERINELMLEGRSVILQPNVSEQEYRIFASNGKAIFVHRKRFPRITGDGKSTIAKLISEVIYLDSKTVETELALNNYSLNTVLPAGEIFKTHFTKKTDPDYFEHEDISEPLKKWTEELCSKLSVDTVGIDVFIKGSVNKPTKITVIELNSNPGLRYLSKYYDDNITPIKIAREILRQYFK